MSEDREETGRPEDGEEDSQSELGGTASGERGTASGEGRDTVQEGEPQETAASSAPAPDIYGVLRFCLGLVIEQAWVHLGLHLAPGMTETRMDLPRAKVAIDAAACIYEYVKPDADEQERRATELALANLRVNFTKKAGHS